MDANGDFIPNKVYAKIRLQCEDGIRGSKPSKLIQKNYKLTIIK